MKGVTNISCFSNCSVVVDQAGDVFAMGSNIKGRVLGDSGNIDNITKLTKIEGAGNIS